MNKNDYLNLQLKSGWDLGCGKKRPLTGWRRYRQRAYELLVGLWSEIGLNILGRRRRIAADTAEGRARRSRMPHFVMIAKDPENYTGVMRRRRRRLLTATVCMLFFAAGICRFAFGPAILLADISVYDQVKIQVTGLKEKNIFITPHDLAQMKKEKVTIKSRRVIGEDTVVIGPTLDTFFDYYGLDKADYISMKCYTATGNSNAYVRTMAEETVILAIADGDRPLSKAQMPLRIIVPDGDAYWTNSVTEIEFKKR